MKKPNEKQAGLFSSLPIEVRPNPPPVVERPKLSVVEPPPEEDVTIEPEGDGRFWLTFIRYGGGVRGTILVTRTQLEKFLRRGAAALEVG